MSPANPPLDTQEVHAYVDGWLAPERRAAVEAALAEDAELAATVAAYQRQNRTLRQAVAALAESETPDRLLAVLRRRRAPALLPALLRIAAALVLLFVGGVGGWVLNDRLGGEAPAAERFVAEAMIAHQVFVNERRHAVEVAADERAHLDTWLGNRLGGEFYAPELSEAGLVFVGGRLLPSEAGGRAAQLMYEEADGQRVTCYIAADGARLTPEPLVERRGDITVFAWQAGELAYAVAASYDEQHLKQIAGLVNRQIEWGAEP